MQDFLKTVIASALIAVALYLGLSNIALSIREVRLRLDGSVRLDQPPKGWDLNQCQYGRLKDGSWMDCSK